jgi:hypothetical protein
VSGLTEVILELTFTVPLVLLALISAKAQAVFQERGDQTAALAYGRMMVLAFVAYIAAQVSI